MKNITVSDWFNNIKETKSLNEEHNSLGLSGKVKKKFDKEDAIDNIRGYLSLDECYEYVVKSFKNYNVKVCKESSLRSASFINYHKSKYYIEILIDIDPKIFEVFEIYIGYVWDGNEHICIFCNNDYIEENILLERFKEYLCNKNWKESRRHIVFCSPDKEKLPIDILAFLIDYVKKEYLS